MRRRRNGGDTTYARNVYGRTGDTRIYTLLALPRLAERHDPAGVLRFSFAPRDRGTAIRCDPMRRDATRRDAMRRVRPRAPRHFSKQYTTNTNQRTSHPVRVLALSAFSRHRRAPLRDSNSVSPPFPFPLSSNSLSLSLSLCPLPSFPLHSVRPLAPRLVRTSKRVSRPPPP